MRFRPKQNRMANAKSKQHKSPGLGVRHVDSPQNSYKFATGKNQQLAGAKSFSKHDFEGSTIYERGVTRDSLEEVFSTGQTPCRLAAGKILNLGKRMFHQKFSAPAINKTL